MIEGEIVDVTRLDGVGPWGWDEIPFCFRRALVRASRLQRLVQMGGPNVVLEAERRMLAEAYLEIGEWVKVACTDPAKALTDDRFEAQVSESLARHLREKHRRLVDSQDLGSLTDLHDALHTSLRDHDVTDWDLDAD